jgi:hypothetical protein
MTNKSLRSFNSVSDIFVVSTKTTFNSFVHFHLGGHSEHVVHSQVLEFEFPKRLKTIANLQTPRSGIWLMLNQLTVKTKLRTNSRNNILYTK